jgi:hypothetical protein
VKIISELRIKLEKLLPYFTLMMAAICSSETSVPTRVTRCDIPEYGILHSHRHENLRSYDDDDDDEPQQAIN